MVSSLLSAEPVITRKVDKTSLLSYQANKYSVPQQWQSSTARVDEQDGQLITYRLNEHEEMARHNLSYEKGQIIKNRHHYRDYEQQLRTV